jgi:hypothetical protein
MAHSRILATFLSRGDLFPYWCGPWPAHRPNPSTSHHHRCRGRLGRHQNGSLELRDPVPAENRDGSVEGLTKNLQLRLAGEAELLPWPHLCCDASRPSATGNLHVELSLDGLPGSWLRRQPPLDLSLGCAAAAAGSRLCPHETKQSREQCLENVAGWVVPVLGLGPERPCDAPVPVPWPWHPSQHQ